MKGIDFLCIGPQRTASSWLDRALRMHPSILLPKHVKETFFFDRNYHRGLDWYYRLYCAPSSHCLYGEVGPTYFESQEALDRILLTNANIRILILVRNPIARTFSLFCHERTKGRAPNDFFDAIRSQSRILESGRYSRIAPKWEAAFGIENILYIVQDDIRRDPDGQLRGIFDFLGIERIDLPPGFEERFGQGVVPRFRLLAMMASRTAAMLRAAGFHKLVELGKRIGLNQVYRGGDNAALTPSNAVMEFLSSEHEIDIDFLEARLGRNFSHWRYAASNTRVNN